MTTTRLAKTTQAAEGMRLDKWLWCARFYKTRALAVEETGRGRVLVNGQPAKAARALRLGDMVAMRRDQTLRVVKVLAFSKTRGPATVAQQLYAETAESQAERARLAEQRRLAPEPAHSLAAGRPTKRDRRSMDRTLEHSTQGWNGRWSASID